MKFKLGGNGGGSKPSINSLLSGVNKKYALIGIGAVMLVLLLIILLSSGGSQEMEIDGSRFENNETEQNMSKFAPPPPPPFDESVFEDGDGEQNATADSAEEENQTASRFEFDDDAFSQDNKQNVEVSKEQENTKDEPIVVPQPKIEEPLPQIKEEQNTTQTVVQPEPTKSKEELKPAPQPQEKILPVENGLSMSQRGISPEKIVEVIDNVSNAEFKCKCDCPICPTDVNANALNQMPPQPQQPLPQQNNAFNNADCVNGGYWQNGQNANNGSFQNGNNQFNGRARVEIRPDDMIIYLKAKQPYMRFDGRNLVFENRTYANGDIFKGWWKIEHTNNVYARFYDDLSGYAYNLRFLPNQGVTK